MRRCRRFVVPLLAVVAFLALVVSCRDLGGHRPESINVARCEECVRTLGPLRLRLKRFSEDELTEETLRGHIEKICGFRNKISQRLPASGSKCEDHYLHRAPEILKLDYRVHQEKKAWTPTEMCVELGYCNERDYYDKGPAKSDL